jgi:hypothetical protein
MDKTQVMSVVGNLSGQHIHVEFKSEGKPSSEFKGVKLEKITSGAFRAGIDYANLSEVKEAIAAGERGEVEPLPWGEWVMFPFHIHHKEKDYLRLYPATGGFIQSPKVTYFMAEHEISKEEYLSMLPPSSRKSSDKPCFVVNMDNIIQIGNE